MGEQKEKRRGGQRDDSKVNIDYSCEQLMQLIDGIEQKSKDQKRHQLEISLRETEAFAAFVANLQKDFTGTH